MSEINAECCGGPAPKEVDACCVKDMEAKSQGDEKGCGCSAVQPKELKESADKSCCDSPNKT